MSERLIEVLVLPGDIPFLVQEIERILQSYEQQTFSKGERAGCLCLKAHTYVVGAAPEAKKEKDEKPKKEKPDDDNRGGASRSKPRRSG